MHVAVQKVNIGGEGIWPRRRTAHAGRAAGKSMNFGDAMLMVGREPPRLIRISVLRGDAPAGRA